MEAGPENQRENDTLQIHVCLIVLIKRKQRYLPKIRIILSEEEKVTKSQNKT